MTKLKKYKFVNTLSSKLSSLATELRWFYRYRVCKPRLFEKSRVKIVAIAKNEACYLPEWIGHHLHFGFDAISIYVNNTEDNTTDIEKKLKGVDGVKFLDGDAFFQAGIDVPQIEIYRKELSISRQEGFSHVMFLDIDEFWTPSDLNSSIHEHIKKIHADIICFEWVNRVNEGEPFLPAICENLKGNKGNHVKSLVGTHVIAEALNPHNVLAYKAVYKLADGSIFKANKQNYAKVKDGDSSLKSSFILHRMYRSQEEYVALLMRGRPIQNRQYADILKTNRNGYIPRYSMIDFNFDKTSVHKYSKALNLFLARYDLLDEINTAKDFVYQKRLELVDALRNAPAEMEPIFSKILARVTLPDVVEAMEHFKTNHGIK